MSIVFHLLCNYFVSPAVVEDDACSPNEFLKAACLFSKGVDRPARVALVNDTRSTRLYNEITFDSS
jgi:hypothetical protein